jgi:GAF domain-containing protein
MSIKLRLTIILALAAAVPLLVVGVWGLNTLQRASTLAIEQSEAAILELGEDELSQPVVELKAQLADIQRTARTRQLSVLGGAALVAFVGAYALGRYLGRPICLMAEAVTRVADGDLRPLRLQERRDEIGALARAFNTMIAQLHDLVAGLETRVAERTEELTRRAAELEESNRQNQRRAIQLEASAGIAHAAFSVLDPDQLLNQVVHLISDRFGHYHTGVFVLDETGRWAILRAANSEGGRRMLARGHQLEVGTQGVIGYVTHTGRPHIGRNVGADATYFDNPDLPSTRTEIALPLIARGQIIGALDIQSTEETAFDEEGDVAVLNALANQIAIALDNARLYEASQVALAQGQATQRQFTSGVWEQYSAQHETDLYEYRKIALASAGDEHLSEADKALKENVTTATAGSKDHPAALAAPIKVRGQVIGALGLQEAEERHVWSAAEIALVETIADQVGQAMEAARLFNETQQRAQREQLVSKITGKIRSAPDIDSTLYTAVQEIRRALGVSHGVVRLGTETHLRPPETNDDSPWHPPAPRAQLRARLSSSQAAEASAEAAGPSGSDPPGQVADAPQSEAEQEGQEAGDERREPRDE